VAYFWSVGIFTERGRLLTDVPVGLDIDEIELGYVGRASAAADRPSVAQVMRRVYAEGLAFCGRAIPAVRRTDRPTIGAHVFRYD
jgi:hypothetical protein